MKLILTYELPDYRRIQFQLLANQSVTVGRTDDAEHPIYVADELEEVHFRIVTTDEVCWLYNLASDFTATSLNGAPVRENLLHDGDQILAGGIVFHILLSGSESVAPPAALAVSVSDARPKLQRSYRHRIGRCGLQVYQDNADNLQVADVMLAIHSQQIFLYLLVNFKAARRVLPDWLAAEDDLFQHAPAEIRQEHSLHLVTDQDLEQTLPRFLDLSDRDAAICVLTDKPPEDFLRENQLLMAWFARPSLLGFHLDNASDDFVGRLMSNLHGVLVKAPHNSSWTLTANPRWMTDWRSLGFDFPPSTSFVET